MATNAAIATVAAGLIWLIGIWPFLLVELPIILLAGSVGVWLFYVQHQFEMTFWAHEADWTFEEAALHGSSHYDLPGILRWFTANIGVHHVHHLCSRIPYYRLPRVLREHPNFAALPDLLCFKVCSACASCFGTRVGGVSYRFVIWACESATARSVQTIAGRVFSGYVDK
jgi:omega-6 fatty acid desaturase (delta-12 desaturase)